MHRLPLLFVLILSALAACSTDSASGQVADANSMTTIYFTRHAEKASGDDPGLLPAGQARAERLARRFSGQKLAAVYATDFRRTQATAAPTAKANGLTVQSYSAGGKAASQTKAWLKKHRGQTILVVGHSNTVPGLVNALVSGAGYGEIDEDDYDRLYKVTIDGKGKGSVQEMSSAR